MREFLPIRTFNNVAAAPYEQVIEEFEAVAIASPPYFPDFADLPEPAYGWIDCFENAIDEMFEALRWMLPREASLPGTFEPHIFWPGDPGHRRTKHGWTDGCEGACVRLTSAWEDWAWFAHDPAGYRRLRQATHQLDDSLEEINCAREMVQASSEAYCGSLMRTLELIKQNVAETAAAENAAA